MKTDRRLKNNVEVRTLIVDERFGKEIIFLSEPIVKERFQKIYLKTYYLKNVNNYL